MRPVRRLASSDRTHRSEPNVLRVAGGVGLRYDRIRLAPHGGEPETYLFELGPTGMCFSISAAFFGTQGSANSAQSGEFSVSITRAYRSFPKSRAIHLPSIFGPATLAASPGNVFALDCRW